MGTLDAFRLDGHVGIVAGGAHNLGFDMTDALAEAGCELVITSRSRERAAEAAERLNAACGIDTPALALDRTDLTSISRMAHDAHAWKVRKDVLINNAGGSESRGPTTFFERTWEDMEFAP